VNLFGTSYTRDELFRRVGRLEQVAGVRLVTLGDGQGRGVRVLEFRTGTGFAFDVLVDRGFDVGRCELGGRPLSWLSGAGVVAPWYYEPDDWGWFRAWGGGMVVTCGLDHTLVPGEDTAEHFNQPHIRKTVRYGLHGRVGGLPARLGGYGERISELPRHTVWRMMGEGTYALALEPSTNRDAGRQDARERGELQWLEPGEERRYVLEIGALTGPAAIGEFDARVSRLAPPEAGAAPGESPSDREAVSRR
jgi:hypothetical protein